MMISFPLPCKYSTKKLVKKHKEKKKENGFYVEISFLLFFLTDQFLLSGLGLKSLESKQVFLLTSFQTRCSKNGNSG